MQSVHTTEFENNPTRILVTIGRDPHVLIIADDLGKELAAQPVAISIRELVANALADEGGDA